MYVLECSTIAPNSQREANRRGWRKQVAKQAMARNSFVVRTRTVWGSQKGVQQRDQGMDTQFKNGPTCNADASDPNKPIRTWANLNNAAQTPSRRQGGFLNDDSSGLCAILDAAAWCSSTLKTTSSKRRRARMETDPGTSSMGNADSDHPTTR